MQLAGMMVVKLTQKTLASYAEDTID